MYKGKHAAKQYIKCGGYTGRRAASSNFLTVATAATLLMTFVIGSAVCLDNRRNQC